MDQCHHCHGLIAHHHRVTGLDSETDAFLRTDCVPKMSAWIPIATVLKPHGVKGAFKVKSETDFKTERFQAGSELKLITPKTTQMITVESFQAMTAGDVLKVKECDDRDLAFSWRGGTLYYDAQKRGELEADAFYFDQLEGLAVRRWKESRHGESLT